ncbi:class D sortase [Niallia sp. XMNu-256]|uniref:class D sortase n=1 Tax=Niallia sp. XMNu-256 TaxID=3082444 RepID=UPI0030CD8232
MRRMIGVVIFLVGIGLTWFYYDVWNDSKSSAETISTDIIEKYEVQLNEGETETIAPAYAADTSENNKSADDQSIVEEVNYEIGQEVAKLIIPDLKMQYSVYWGTDSNVLMQGVGMFISDSTTTPKGMKHTVLSGHRDTVFTRLGELEIGDRIIVEYDGSLYEYRINKTWITHSDDRTVIVSKDSPTLTLTTCYPFEFIGDAPDRYIIQADLISTT